MASTERQPRREVEVVPWSRYSLAAVLAGVILVASIVSVELDVTVTLLELTLGVVAGDAFDLHSQEWLDFIASFASIVLTFLAGWRSEPITCGTERGPPVGIGVVSFTGPFVSSTTVAAYTLLDWTGSLPHRGDGVADDLARSRLCRPR